MEGRRQRHVPPFRLFLVTLLIFMFSAEAALNHRGQVTAADRTSRQGARTYTVGRTRFVVVTGVSNLKTQLAQQSSASAFSLWLRDHIGRAVQNRDYYFVLVFEWAHRLAVLMLPILAGLLTLCYVYKRQFYVYDHLVVAMQYLSFCFLVWAPVWVAPKWLSYALLPVAAVWTPFNLYLILRTAYGSGRVGAAMKAFVLWSSTVVVFGLLLVGLLAYVLNQM